MQYKQIKDVKITFKCKKSLIIYFSSQQFVPERFMEKCDLETIFINIHEKIFNLKEKLLLFMKK